MKILIIEDDAGIAELFREELVELDHLVSWVDTFADADKHLQGDIPDLMIVDYSLSKHDNAQDWLLQRGAHSLPIPDFIVSTGQGDERIAVEMMKLGARDYIIKDSMLMSRLPDIVTRIAIEKEKEIRLLEADLRIEEQLKFTQLLMEISTSFINLPLSEVESAIQHSLDEISLFVNADQSYIVRYDFEQRLAILDHEWCNTGFTPRIESLKAIPMGKMDNWIDLHKKGEIVYVHDMTQYDQKHVKADANKYGIKSVIAIPMMNDGQCVGYVSFDSIRENRVYSESEYNLFKVFTQLLVNIHNRRQQVEALRLSGERYQLLFDLNPQPMWVFDLETLQFLEVNDAAIEHYGFSRTEFLSMTLRDVRTKDDVDQMYSNIEFVKKNDRSVFLARHITKEHHLIDVELTSVRVVWNEKAAIHSMVNDVTEKKLAQEKLQEKRDVLRKVLMETSQLIESGDAGVNYSKLTELMCEISGAKFVGVNEYINNNKQYITRSFTGVTDFVRNSINILGFNLLEKKWKSDPFQNTGVERDALRVFKGLAEVSEKVLPASVIKLLERTFKIGEVVVVSIMDNDKLIGDFVLLFKKGVQIKNSEIVEMFASQVGQYIVRKRTEITMRESEKSYRQLFSNNPQAMLIYDIETLAFLEVNEVAIQAYGYSRKEFLSMSILDIRPTEDIPATIKWLIASKEQFIRNYQSKHLKKSGEIVLASVTSTAVEFENKHARHVLINSISEYVKPAEKTKPASELS